MKITHTIDVNLTQVAGTETTFRSTTNSSNLHKSIKNDFINFNFRVIKYSNSQILPTTESMQKSRHQHGADDTS